MKDKQNRESWLKSLHRSLVSEGSPFWTDGAAAEEFQVLTNDLKLAVTGKCQQETILAQVWESRATAAVTVWSYNCELWPKVYILVWACPV